MFPCVAISSSLTASFTLSTTFVPFNICFTILFASKYLRREINQRGDSFKILKSKLILLISTNLDIISYKTQMYKPVICCYAK